MTIKLRLKRDVSVADEHGLTKGRVLEMLRDASTPGWWVMGDAGEEVKVLPHEAEIIGGTINHGASN